MKTIKISDIKIRMDLYPRLEVNNSKVQEYSENIENLPPIIINQDNILIDGLHRFKAHKQVKLTEIDCEIEKTKNENEIKLRAIELNAKHGLQLNYEDKRKLAVELFNYENDSEKIEIKERLVRILSIHRRTFERWVADIEGKRKEEKRRQIIFEYLKAELTQEDVANKFGVSRPLIAQIVSDLSSNGHLPIPDNFKYPLFNLWNPLKDNQITHFGNIPQTFIENLLYYYTEPFDVIYDPLAGGGITIDACKKWYRRYYVSDRKPIGAREDEIKKWEIQNGIPGDLPNKIKLIFLDPPYWKQSEGKYSKDKNDLANMPLNEFYGTLITFIKQLKKKLAKDGRIALIIGASQWCNKDYEFVDHASDLIERFKKIGFKIDQRIICPYSTEQYNGTQVNIAKEKKICLNIYRDLMVFKL